MWFGISVYDLALILVNESKKWIIRIFGSINYEKLTLIALKFKQIISKLDEILSKLTIIIFSILMLCQLFEVITIYLDFEIVTRFEVQHMMFLPKIEILKLPMLSNSDELMKIYPEMKHKIVILDSNKTYPEIPIKYKKLINQPIFENGLIQLLMDNRLNDFHRIAETEKTFKTCHIVINNKLINCSKVDTGVNVMTPGLLIITELTYSGIVDKSKIEKITLSLNPFEILFVHIFLSHSNSNTRALYSLQPNTKQN
jgi:hypothetical protein